MTSDIERPRQRTVAELLAEHGDAASSARRRRRRSSDDEPVTPPPGRGIAPVVAQRMAPSVQPPMPDAASHQYFQPSDDERREAYHAASRPDYTGYGTMSQPVESVPPQPPVWPELPAARTEAPAREFPTDVMPRITAPPAAFDPGPAAEDTGPIPLVAPPQANRFVERPAPAPDGGPPTQFSPGIVEDDDVAEWDDEWSDEEWAEDADEGVGEPRPVDDGADDGYTDDGYTDDDPAEADPDEDPAEAPRAEPKDGPGWPAVVAQWIAGAVSGAALWVAFRYLWQDLRVVAVAAALLVTGGLVVLVRSVLRNRDNRTTVFAVLVGLLLTVSPAILVWIGR